MRKLASHYTISGRATNLVFAQKREMEENGKRSGVGSQNDDLGNSSIEGLRSLVGPLLELTIMRRLLDDIENLLL